MICCVGGERRLEPAVDDALAAVPALRGQRGAGLVDRVQHAVERELQLLHLQPLAVGVGAAGVASLAQRCAASKEAAEAGVVLLLALVAATTHVKKQLGMHVI